MPPYVVLARKWRPAQFANIVGQSHIVRTLTNAIRLERIHQAYLFTGARGVGKTSIARIFAKVVRCSNIQDENGTLKSCDHCPNCKEITAGSSVDVIEIDGASNNGVEAVREIRENAKYMPSSGSRKIYIIDEVHMLTTAAFNALLKTLEEPPSHVIFIFATTEPHKIPATILSRCQRFDYRRVNLTQIQTRLKEITEAEGIDAETGALALISRAAEGSMRDALSLLDQVIAFAGSQVSIDSVRESVGLIDGQVILGILAGIFKREPIQALKLIEQAFEDGHDLRVLTRSLIEFLHGALLAKIGSTNSGALEFSEEEWKELRSISELRPLEEIELVFQVLHQGLEWVAKSPQPKIVLDVLTIKCASADALLYVDSISQQSPPPNMPQPGTSSATSSIPKRVEIPRKEGLSATAASSITSILKALPQSPVPSPEIPISSASGKATPQLKDSKKTWEGMIEFVRKTRPLLASILEHACDTQLPDENPAAADRLLIINFSSQNGYFREQLQSRNYQDQLMNLNKEYFGGPVRLQLDIKNQGESLIHRREREKKEQTDLIKERIQNHPIILEAKSLFGGDLGPIDVLEGNHANR
ncbi:MAG: DNA polymerase III subunit gamma/tau [Bdellovibrionia bacterium]